MTTDKRYEQLVGILKKTGEDVRAEAQRLLSDWKDPEMQQRVKESLKEIGTWARQTAEEVTDIVEKTVRRAEDALTGAAARVGVKIPTTRQRSSSAAASAEPSPGRKTTGRRKGGKKSRTASAAAKKSVGKSKS